MIKKITELSLGEMGRICKSCDSCKVCPFNKLDNKYGTDFCDIVSKIKPTENDRLLDMSIELPEESVVPAKKNDSSANLEARIEKLEKQVEELNEWRCRL